MIEKMEKLTNILSKVLNTTIVHTEYHTKRLCGGTVGTVKLITGIAETTTGNKLPYSIVWKKQKKWERYDDPNSWRREYDLYRSDLNKAFTHSFRWPTCYHAEINTNENEIQLWMEYIEGIIGLDLTIDMYERAAEELGRFQGRLYAEQPSFLQSLTNMGKLDYAKNFYLHYRSWPVVYDYIRSKDCEIPQDICNMLIRIDENSEEILKRIETLPIVLCHRDFWVTNILYSNDSIVLIDWDTAGWGYLGEDIASLIADESDVSLMVEYYRRCIPAYYKGFSEYVDISHITDHCIYELILIMFGYRLIEWYLHAETNKEKELYLKTLQAINEMENVKVI